MKPDFSQRILITDLGSRINDTVSVAGFLYKKREVSSKLAFLVLRDRTGLVQVVIENNELEIDKLKGLQNGSILKITATVKKDERASGGVELINPEFEIVNPVYEVPAVEIDKEINHNSENFDTLFENRPITLRNWQESRIFKIRETIKNSIRTYLKTQDFTEFESPKILAGATEGGAEVFTMDYFGQTVALAQSAQFYKQIMVGVFERVFEINPTYRAELSFTPRHMTEFTHIDVELGFVNSLDDVLEIAQNLVKSAINSAWENNKNDLELLKATRPIVSDKFPVVTLSKLFEIYKQETGIDDSHEKDPSPVHERFICDYSAKHWNSEAVFVTEFPSSEMKFYHKVNDSNPDVCDRADLLFRGVELATVPLREHRYEVLIQQMTKAGLNPEDQGNKYYVSAFRHGLPPHGGFGMGFDRLVQKIIGLSSVKEAVLFPRDVRRMTP
jgi:nondiscriminating aspartyl-tRNA synthetase